MGIHQNALHEFGMEERFLAKDTTNAFSKMCASTSFESSIGSLDVDHFFERRWGPKGQGDSVCSSEIDAAGLFTNDMLHCSRL